MKVNAEMARQGYVWVYRKYSEDPGLLSVEAEARNAKKGLWADPIPVPPWE
jgi:micrococcal nuclease